MHRSDAGPSLRLSFPACSSTCSCGRCSVLRASSPSLAGATRRGCSRRRRAWRVVTGCRCPFPRPTGFPAYPTPMRTRGRTWWCAISASRTGFGSISPTSLTSSVQWLGPCCVATGQCGHPTATSRACSYPTREEARSSRASAEMNCWRPVRTRAQGCCQAAGGLGRATCVALPPSSRPRRCVRGVPGAGSCRCPGSRRMQRPRTCRRGLGLRSNRCGGARA